MQTSLLLVTRTRRQTEHSDQLQENYPRRISELTEILEKAVNSGSNSGIVSRYLDVVSTDMITCTGF